jgi:hypothetical protein
MVSETMSTSRPEPTRALHSIPARPNRATSPENALFEKRRDTRYSTCEPVDVYLLDMQGLRLPGILRDVSRNGLRIEINMPLKAGDRLEVVLENRAIVFGEIRYCRRLDGCYHAGVLIGDVLYPKTILPTGKAERTRNWGAERAQVAVKRSSSPAPAVPPGTHISAKEAHSFFRGQLSDTKAALIDRHLTSCSKCLDVVLLTLEKKLSSAASARGVAKFVCETQLR